MRLSPSDIHILYKPNKCELRVYLKERGKPEAEPSAYAEVLRKLGKRFELAHLASLTRVVDLSGIQTREAREIATKVAVASNASAIYQPALRASANINGTVHEIIGDPDFLINVGGTYTIRDVKISRRITEKDHPEILRQLELYGWLFKETFGQPPGALEVFSGKRELVSIPFDDGKGAMLLLSDVVSLKNSSTPPYSPVGWTKCNSCGFREICWPEAESRKDVALVVGVDQALARVLRSSGVETFDQLIQSFDEAKLSELKKPFGQQMRKVGKGAGPILQSAKALATGKEYLIKAPAIPVHPNYVMFDLEGLPPQMDDLQKIYLWGLQVFGETPGPFMPAVAGFGDAGDKEGWFGFIDACSKIFEKHGDIPFVHWATYEKTNIKMYIERFGDVGGVAQRVIDNLLDLLPITEDSIILPLPTYGLKAIEKYAGFKRTQTEYGGDWSIAKYIEAVETEDASLRATVMDAILTYNREDLEATWAVFEWLRGKKLD